MGNALVTDFLEARNWPSGSARAVSLILIMIVTIAGVPVVREPRPPDPRGQRPVTAPAVTDRRRAGPPFERRRARRTAGPASSSSTSGSTRSWSTRSCTCRSSSSSCSPSTAPTGSSPSGAGSRLKWFEYRARRRRRQGRAAEQLHRRDPERDPGHDLRDDGRPRPPAGRQAGPARLRHADLHERDRARDRHRARDAGALRDRASTSIKSTFGIKFTFGYPTIIAAHVLFNLSLVLLLVRARLSGMDRTLTDASADLFATPWRTFRQITFPQLLPAIVAGFLLSFTFSFDDYVITTFTSGPGSSTLPLYIFGQVQARRDPGDQRGRHDDAGPHPDPAVHRPARADLAGRAGPGAAATPGWPRSSPRPERSPAPVRRPRRLGRGQARVGGEQRRPCRCAPTAGRGPAGRSGRRPRSAGRSAGAGRARR